MQWPTRPSSCGTTAADGDEPAFDAPGVLGTLEVPMDMAGASKLPIHTFRKAAQRMHKERVERWLADVRQLQDEEFYERLAVGTDTGWRADYARAWTCEEVCMQSLHGNVHLEPGPDWSGRLTTAAEKRSVRWAAAGIRTVGDLLNTEASDRARLMTFAEADLLYDEVGLTEV